MTTFDDLMDAARRSAGRSSDPNAVAQTCARLAYAEQERIKNLITLGLAEYMDADVKQRAISAAIRGLGI